MRAAAILFCSFIWVCLGHGPVHSQSILQQQQELQRQVDELRRDMADLQTTVGGLRRIILRQGMINEQLSGKQPDPAVLPDSTPKEEEKIKAELCQAVGRFFGHIDRAVKMPDGEAAEELMRTSLSQLSSELDRYGRYPRVRHILSIADRLALDAYDAVITRNSITGNREFIEVIDDHRKRYRAVCPTP